MGLGRFGGGTSVTRWLAGEGARVTVTDMAPAEALAEPLAEIDDLVRSDVVTLALGGHREDDFTQTDLVVANPAVPKPWANRYLNAGRAAGVEVTTEIRLLIERLPRRERVVGITGSAGKSTTTAMIAAGLAAAGAPVVMGGNIGGSLLPRLGEITSETWVVMELSSAMLHWLSEGFAWSPGVAVVTNVSPNHADWHGDDAHYVSSKQKILMQQTAEDAAVLGEGVRDWAELTRASVEIIAARDALGGLAIPGAHNGVNAAVALAACGGVLRREGVNGAEFERRMDAARQAIRDFPGLPHRLQRVQGRAGMRFFNDSKCTTPAALAQAVAALTEGDEAGAARLHVIVGGYDKQVPLTEVARLGLRTAGLYCVGATGPTIAREARDLGAASTRVHECGTVARAVEAALARMRAGDTLLLAPASASWDQFPNYEHRGNEFVRLVQEAADACGPAHAKGRESC